MKRWSQRPPEEQRLLNPSFCAVLLWHSARAHAETRKVASGIPFEECFLVLPMLLHREIRESLPKKLTTSLPVWIGRNPLAPSIIADRARALVPFTKEALRFGGAYGVLKFNGATIFANPDWRLQMTEATQNTSDEVRACAKRADFLGKWFSKTGDAETVLSFLGVQP